MRFFDQIYRAAHVYSIHIRLVVRFAFFVSFFHFFFVTPVIFVQQNHIVFFGCTKTMLCVQPAAHSPNQTTFFIISIVIVMLCALLRMLLHSELVVGSPTKINPRKQYFVCFLSSSFVVTYRFQCCCVARAQAACSVE